MNLKEIKEVINTYQLSIKKHYGQNFLIDQNVVGKICELFNITKDINVIEIGPGIGSLTDEIVKRCNKLMCYEIDSQLINHLNKRFNSDNVLIIEQDFLKSDLKKDIDAFFDDKDIYVISNLPYYITSSIILKLIDNRYLVKQLTLMMQKEVADRICSKPSTKDYNSLSVLVQYYSNPKQIIQVPPSCFYPSPDVNSTVVKFEFYETKPFTAINEDFFKSFIILIFHQKRKTLVNNLKQDKRFSIDIIKTIFNNNNLVENVRSEQLTIEQIVNLCNDFYEVITNAN